ncbi:unnamed protein product, partial [Amoebophrya sp. A25]|eukprot:GSA25T00001747001.1
MLALVDGVGSPYSDCHTAVQMQPSLTPNGMDHVRPLVFVDGNGHLQLFSDFQQNVESGKHPPPVVSRGVCAAHFLLPQRKDDPTLVQRRPCDMQKIYLSLHATMQDRNSSSTDVEMIRDLFRYFPAVWLPRERGKSTKTAPSDCAAAGGVRGPSENRIIGD